MKSNKILCTDSNNIHQHICADAVVRCCKFQKRQNVWCYFLNDPRLIALLIVISRIRIELALIWCMVRFRRNSRFFSTKRLISIFFLSWRKFPMAHPIPSCHNAGPLWRSRATGCGVCGANLACVHHHTSCQTSIPHSHVDLRLLYNKIQLSGYQTKMSRLQFV